jgi:hypothetical protein
MTEWPLKRIRVGRRFRKNMGDLRPLAESIETLGLLHPVVVTPQGLLIAGRRRLEAVRLLRWRSVPVHVVDLESVIEGELAENVHRKDFLPSELWAIAKKVKERVRTPVGRPSSEMPENYRHFQGDTRDKAAAYFGVSGRHQLTLCRDSDSASATRSSCSTARSSTAGTATGSAGSFASRRNSGRSAGGPARSPR